MAYYSKLVGIIYHECQNCTVGNNMVEGNLIEGIPPTFKGRDGKIKKPRLCKTCKKLKAKELKGKGKCIPGIPELPEPGRGDTVETYYSTERPEIFHMCQNCNVGQNIEKDNLVANQPPLVMKRKKARLCKTCVGLCIAGKCIPGTPKPAGP
jgi:hypothetical protein